MARRPKTTGRYEVPAYGRLFPSLNVALTFAQIKVTRGLSETLSVEVMGREVARVERADDRTTYTVVHKDRLR